MNYSFCCGARVFHVGNKKKPKVICHRCRKECKPVLYGNWKDVYKGK